MKIYSVFYPVICYKQPMPTVTAKRRPAPSATPPARTPRHLAATEHERAVTEFEQTLIGAAEAFYRFAGALLGPEGRAQNISGEDCVILQQLVGATGPRRVADLGRFANRDDVANIQYSLKKLIRAGWVRRVKSAAARDSAFVATDSGHAVSARLVALRRDLLIAPSAELAELDPQLRAASRTLGLLTGFYDHATRIIAGRG
jgi:predicted MarR family transcription regulator